jgi:hypothetical protein
MGVKPDTGLARRAGLEIGVSGGIRVDDSLRTSDPQIWAVGDAVQVTDVVTGMQRVAPLAGLAIRQGRTAADSICGRPSKFRGAQVTAVCGFFEMTVAMTGATQKTLRQAGITNYQVVYLHPDNHAAYYPEASPIHLKLLFSVPEGRILGAQAVGEEGVEKRIDVIALAIQKQATVFDLEECELCYAPQYGAGRDPANVAGMVAANVLRGDVKLWHGAAILFRRADPLTKGIRRTQSLGRVSNLLGVEPVIRHALSPARPDCSAQNLLLPLLGSGSVDELLIGTTGGQAAQPTEASFAREGAGKQFRPFSTQLFDPALVLRPELPLELLPQAMRQLRTASAGRDGNLEVSAPDNGRIEEVAVEGIIDGVAQHAAPAGALRDPLVDSRR